MVDASLPYKLDHRLSVLFLDLNSYFASCEQQEHPELRGKPVVVAPVDSDSTCAIAASYEAKAYGIKTGTNIGEAKRLCKNLVVVGATPQIYVRYHEKIVEIAESVLHVERVCSIDEMRFRLMGKERETENAVAIAKRLKAKIRAEAGDCMTCSVGIASNGFLAKLGTEMQKPDGLVVLQASELPDRIKHLKLTDFNGINRKMAARLQAAGIFSVERMYAASPAELRSAFGSLNGERWWYLIRGYEAELELNERKTLSHSHVLPPSKRSDEGCREVLLRLIQKGSARLRSEELCARGFGVSVHGFDRSWKVHARLDPTQDSVTFNDTFLQLWQSRDFVRPRTVGIVFFDLAPATDVTPSLFDFSAARDQLNKAVDSVNKRYGKNTIYIAAIQGAKDTASEKIAFHKTTLFSEGKGDNEA